MSSIGISITTACDQCHVNFPVNALSTEVHCPDCNQRLAIDWSTWCEVLSAAAVDGPNAAPNQHHLEALTGGSNTTLVRNYVRKDAACVRCKAVVPLPRALQAADHGFCICVQCGEKISLRAAPNEIKQLGGISHIIGEELTASAKARLFYLWHDRPAQAAQTGGQRRWHDLKDVVCDRDGHFYFLHRLDQRDGELQLISTDAQFNLRWTRDSLTTSSDRLEHPQLSLTPNGYLILRGKDRHHALVVSCADGTTAMSLGGREDPSATAHGFDLKDCTTLTCDIDGTILASIHKRLLRWTYDGQPLETWPGVTGFFGGHQKLQPLYRMGSSEEREKIGSSEKYPPGPKEIGNHPYELEGELHVGFDGLLVYRESHDYVKFDRQGKVVMRATTPSELSYEGRIQTDGLGNTYELCQRDYGRRIMRISPDGKRVEALVDGSRPGTPIWDGSFLVVLVDGTMFTFDDDGSARCFNADGSLRFVTPKAREADKAAVRRHEEEAR